MIIYSKKLEVSKKGGENMNVRILRHYFRYCEKHNLEPSFQGLKEYNELTKGLYIPK